MRFLFIASKAIIFNMINIFIYVFVISSVNFFVIVFEYTNDACSIIKAIVFKNRIGKVQIQFISKKERENTNF